MNLSSSRSAGSQGNALVPGLSLHKFLQTLDWVCHTHQDQPTSSSKHTTQCSACKPTTSQSTSEEIRFSPERIQGKAIFLIGSDHFISFSPSDNSQKPLSHIPAILTIEDGDLRLALTPKIGQNAICLRINTEKIENTPELTQTNDQISLTIRFQSLTIVLESPRANGQATEKGATVKLSHVKIREQIIQMQNGTSTTIGKTAPNRVSLLEESIQETKKDLDAINYDIRKQFTQFLENAISFHMPDCFPYLHEPSTFSQSTMNQQNHSNFVDSFVQLEVMREGLKRQAALWVNEAKRRPPSDERMLKPEEIKKRRVELTMNGYENG